MKKLQTLAGLTLLAAASTSCGDVVRQGKAPVFIVVDRLQGVRGAADAGEPSGTLFSDSETLVTAPEPCSADSPCRTIFSDSGQVTMHLSPKDVSGSALSAPSSNNAVTLYRYHVNYRRSDGRNTQGIDVPYAIDGAATGTITPGGSLTLSFELVRHTAKKESPIVQTVANNHIISTVAEVTFYGRDQVGNEISAVGAITVNFGNFGDF